MDYIKQFVDKFSTPSLISFEEVLKEGVDYGVLSFGEGQTKILTEYYGQPVTPKFLSELQMFNPKKVRVIGITREEKGKIVYDGYNMGQVDVRIFIDKNKGGVIDQVYLDGKILVYKPKGMITGKLSAYAETGTEGVLWSLFDEYNQGYDSLHTLQDGDKLKIYSDKTKTKIVFDGVVSFEYERLYKPYPLNPEYGQQVEPIYGCFVHGFQSNVEPHDWSKWFFDGLFAELIKKE